MSGAPAGKASGRGVRAGGEVWDKVLSPASGWLDVRLPELWRYRDLIALFVRRDFVSVYRQTVLGPLWYLLQPLLTTGIFTVVFGRIARLPTDGVPQPLFYLAGIVAWRYFADCLTKTSDTFAGNAGLFGKVYFPRLVVPVSVVVSNLTALGIQMLLFVAMLAAYLAQGASLHPRPLLLALLPLLLLEMALLGLGLGILASALTTRYRDLTHLVGFGVQLWMFATPIVYPVSSVPERLRWAVALNPMAPVVETFRCALLGAGTVRPGLLVASAAMTAVALLAGLALFSRVEKTFMDTV